MIVIGAEILIESVIMRLSFVAIQNFRRLNDCRIDFNNDQTLFVGANNSGKTSAMDAMGKFLSKRRFVFNDIALSNRWLINGIGKAWEGEDGFRPEHASQLIELMPTMDVWLEVEPEEIYYVVDIIPTLDWTGGKLGVRLINQPNCVEQLYAGYKVAYQEARMIEKGDESESTLQIYPKNLCDYLERNFNKECSVKAYMLDPERDSGDLQMTDYSMECLSPNPFEHIIQVDMIGAQRDLSDPDKKGLKRVDQTRLSSQVKEYYKNNLDLGGTPSPEDVDILRAVEKAEKAFDEDLKTRLGPVFAELEHMGYPGFADPKIVVNSAIDAAEALKHDSAIKYSLSSSDEDLLLPEKYLGLGYQNLISIIFSLINFRDRRLHKRKGSSTGDPICPLHLVLVEEPEAHLHVQVQQVFVERAYGVLTNDEHVKDGSFRTQLVVSTHSSSIARGAGFRSLRYFKKLTQNNDQQTATSKVVNLSNVFGEDEATSKFVTRYLQTTHCDLFFADGAILVEGAAEMMLLPHFIRNKYERLGRRYITILNINGRHAHRLGPLIHELALPTLVITDLDPADPNDRRKGVEPARRKGYVSSNYSITRWIVKEDSLDNLLNLSSDRKVLEDCSVCDYKIRVAYQTPITVSYKSVPQEKLSKTFEDSLIYTNLEKISGLKTSRKSEKDINPDELGSLLGKVIKLLDEDAELSEISETMYKELEKSGVKAEFALDLIYSIDPKKLEIPEYIKEGLTWLDNELSSGE